MSYPTISLATATVGRQRCPQKRLQIALQLPVYPNSSPDHRACNSLTPLLLSSRRLSVSTGGFGVSDLAVAFVATPYHSDSGLSLSQFVLFLQFAPPVVLYKATSTAQSVASAVAVATLDAGPGELIADTR